jgi:imidazolonepropionase-like amidohydrolase
MFSGTDTAYRLAKKYKIKTAFGTDILFDAEAATSEGAKLTELVRWYTPAEALKMATADNAQLLALSGKRSPYAGTLGVVAEGALADLLLIDGDPLADIGLIANPAKYFCRYHEGRRDLQEHRAINLPSAVGFRVRMSAQAAAPNSTASRSEAA